MGQGESTTSEEEKGANCFFALFGLPPNDFHYGKSTLILIDDKNGVRKEHKFSLVDEGQSENTFSLLSCHTKGELSGKFQLKLNSKYGYKENDSWEPYGTFREYEKEQPQFIFRIDIAPRDCYTFSGSLISDKVKEISIYLKYLISNGRHNQIPMLVQQFRNNYKNIKDCNPQPLFKFLEEYYSAISKIKKEDWGSIFYVSGEFSNCLLDNLTECKSIMEKIKFEIPSIEEWFDKMDALIIRGFSLQLSLSFKSEYSDNWIKILNSIKSTTIKAKLINGIIECLPSKTMLTKQKIKALKEMSLSLPDSDKTKLLERIFFMQGKKIEDTNELIKKAEKTYSKLWMSYLKMQDLFYEKTEVMSNKVPIPEYITVLREKFTTIRDDYVNLRHTQGKIVKKLEEQIIDFEKVSRDPSIKSLSPDRNNAYIEFVQTFSQFRKNLKKVLKSPNIGNIQNELSSVVPAKNMKEQENKFGEYTGKIVELENKVEDLSRKALEENYCIIDTERVIESTKSKIKDATQKIESSKAEIERLKAMKEKTEFEIKENNERISNSNNESRELEEKRKKEISEISKLDKERKEISGKFKDNPPYHFVFVLGQTYKGYWEKLLESISEFIGERDASQGDCYSIVTLDGVKSKLWISASTKPDIMIVPEPYSTSKNLGEVMKTIGTFSGEDEFHKMVLLFVLNDVTISKQDNIKNELQALRKKNQAMLTFAIGNSFEVMMGISSSGNNGCNYCEKYEIECVKIVDNNDDIKSFLIELSRKLAPSAEVIKYMGNLKTINECIAKRKSIIEEYEKKRNYFEKMLSQKGIVEENLGVLKEKIKDIETTLEKDKDKLQTYKKSFGECSDKIAMLRKKEKDIRDQAIEIEEEKFKIKRKVKQAENKVRSQTTDNMKYENSVTLLQTINEFFDFCDNAKTFAKFIMKLLQQYVICTKDKVSIEKEVQMARSISRINSISTSGSL